jgi:hypothetical protein
MFLYENRHVIVSDANPKRPSTEVGNRSGDSHFDGNDPDVPKPMSPRRNRSNPKYQQRKANDCSFNHPPQPSLDGTADCSQWLTKTSALVLVHMESAALPKHSTHFAVKIAGKLHSPQHVQLFEKLLWRYSKHWHTGRLAQSELSSATHVSLRVCR